MIAPVTVAAATAADTTAVYRRALETLFESGREQPGVIVVLDSAVSGTAVYCANAPCSLSAAVDLKVDSSALRNYAAALRQPGVLQRNIAGRIPVRYLSAAELETFQRLGAANPNAQDRHDQPPDPFWDEFRRRFPRAWGITLLSRIGFNDNADKALLQVRHICGGSCVSMESMFLEKRHELWMLESRFPEESNDWIGQGELRFVGREARARAKYLRKQDSIAMAKADSIARSKAPRRITGTVRSAQTGYPIRFAQVYVGNFATVGKPWARIVADSVGRYEIRNPVMGGNTLIAQCPGKTDNPARVLDMRGIYVWPALDTVFNLEPRTIAPCWKSRRPGYLVQGWLDSNEARMAETPDDDEREIYSRALSTLEKERPRKRVSWIYHRTVPRCEHHQRCGTVSLAALLGDGLVDSSTAANFELQSIRTFPLNPGFAHSRELAIVTPGLIQYFADESTDAWFAPDGDMESHFWSAFTKHEGAHARIIGFTKIGFNPDRSEAIVEARVDSSAVGWNALPRMMFFRKTNAIWTLRIADVGRIGTTGRFEGDRCVASVLKKSITRKELESLDGDFVVTIVPSSGRRDTRVVRMRISRKGRDPMKLQGLDGLVRVVPFAKKDTTASKPAVFEIIDDKTGEPNDAALEDFFLAGPYFAIERRTSTIRLDGYSQSLMIRRLDQRGFTGTYQAGVFGPSEFGVFCAERVGKTRSP